MQIFLDIAIFKVQIPINKIEVLVLRKIHMNFSCEFFLLKERLIPVVKKNSRKFFLPCLN